MFRLSIIAIVTKYVLYIIVFYLLSSFGFDRKLKHVADLSFNEGVAEKPYIGFSASYFIPL